MQVNELVNVVQAFPGVSSLCAFGCQSGRLGIFDAETNQCTYNTMQNEPIRALAIDEDNVIYSANEHNVFRYDKRSPGGPTPQFQSESEILDLAVNGPSIIAATKSNGIVLSDGRNLQRKIDDNKINSIPTSKCSFCSQYSIIAGYDDADIVIWDFQSEAIETLETPRLLKNRKLKPLGIACFTFHQKSNYIVGYESGFSIYNDKKFEEHSSFDQKGKFGKMTHAPCFENDFLAVVIDESSILPLGVTDRRAVTPMTLHGVSIGSISANHLMIVAADDDDEGYIAMVMPEAFGDEFY